MQRGHREEENREPVREVKTRAHAPSKMHDFVASEMEITSK